MILFQFDWFLSLKQEKISKKLYFARLLKEKQDCTSNYELFLQQKYLLTKFESTIVICRIRYSKTTAKYADD